MAGITLAQAEAHLANWLAADDAVAKGQAHSIGGRSYTRADAAEITRKIDYWSRWVTRLQGGRAGMRVRYGITDP